VPKIQTRFVAEYIAMVVLVLMAVGTVSVFSASAAVGRQPSLERFYEFPALRQILFFPLAFAVMYGACLFDYRRFSLVGGWTKSPSTYLLAFSVVLLVLVLVPGIGVAKHFARRWFEIPLGQARVSFQPSELAKWSLVIFLAAFCDRFGPQLHLYRKRFLPACLLIALIVG